MLCLREVHATVAARNSTGLPGQLDCAHVRDLPEDDGSVTRLVTHTAPLTSA
ncbi:hypothetical protein [Streptomyces sp. NPDC060194]|uniref:hypothetical protein n=1 Tax=Streptomyces sp. NPDC060194 TaxID=3347069 RepID=UPI0036540561